MAYFEWKNVYSVGNTKIDQQHQKLFDIANRFHSAFEGEKSHDELESIFSELLDYTRFHFHDEEELMRMHQYPDLEQHSEKHQQLLELVMRLRKELDARKAGVEVEIVRFLKTWLSGHILGIDTRYRAYVNA